MKKQITVRTVRRVPIEVDKYADAVIELAIRIARPKERPETKQQRPERQQ